MPRRVKRPLDKEEIYRQLTTDGDHKIFDTLKDVFLFAACVGHKAGESAPFDKVGGDIPWSVFHGDTDAPIIDSIALTETEEIKILLRDDDTYDRKLKIVEDYANYGMVILRQRIINSSGSPLDNLVSLILENEDSEQSDSKISDFISTLFDKI